MTEPTMNNERAEADTLPLSSAESACTSSRTPDDSERPKKPVRKDAVAAWRQEVRPAATVLREVRLDGSTRLLVPFTHTVEEVEVHYLEYPSLRGYCRCNGPQCTLCRIGRNRESRDLLPVYDPVAREVVVLPVSPSLRPGALKPQLMHVLEQVKNNKSLLVTVRKPDRATFSVTVTPLPENADDGCDVILDFLQKYDSGGCELCSIYSLLGNQQLAVIPEIVSTLRTLGMDS
jgi:hypothetical protein